MTTYVHGKSRIESEGLDTICFACYYTADLHDAETSSLPCSTNSLYTAQESWLNGSHSSLHRKKLCAVMYGLVHACSC